MDKTALVLTDNPSAVSSALSGLDVTCVHLPTARLMVRALVEEVECCGIVLDVRLVMQTPAEVRNRLFALAGGKPIVRCRIDGEQCSARFLDPLESLQGVCPMDRCNQRLEERVKVRLDAVWAMDDDPSMADSYEAVVLDISSGGAFLHAPYMLPAEDFLNLRILNLANQRPIQCAVRWRKKEAGPGQFAGVGVKFMDLTEDQFEEIRKRFLDPSAC